MIEIIKQAVANKFSEHPDRLKHTEGVVETAVMLAKRYEVDVDQAALAAWFHDYTKYDDIADQIRYLDLKIVKKYSDVSEVYHAFSAAAILELNFQIKDKLVLDAIRYHVWGRPNMTKLEKIIFLADKIEPLRTYSDVDKIRQLSLESLDLALIKLFESLNEYYVRTNLELTEDFRQAFNYLKEELKSE